MRRFLYWKANHFKLVEKETLKTMENFPEEQGIKIREYGRYALWKSFAKYLDDAWNNTSSKCIKQEEQKNLMKAPNLDYKTPSAVAKNDDDTRTATNLPWKSLECEEYSNSTTERKGMQSNANGSRRGRPADVSKLFARELRYGGTTAEPHTESSKTSRMPSNFAKSMKKNLTTQICQTSQIVSVLG